MDTKLAAGLIALTAIGTYGLSQLRRHHFEQTKLGDGSIVLDTETGVECSARFGMKWTDTNKKAVWAAGLAAKKLEAEHTIHVSSGVAPKNAADAAAPPANTVPVSAGATLGDALPPLQSVDYIDQTADLLAAEDKYNRLVQKADNERIPDPDSSYFLSFPLCRDIR